MNDLKHRKRELHKLEDRFKDVIELNSDELEDNIKSTLKIGAVVGVSLFVAYKTYKLIAPKPKKDKSSGSEEVKTAGFIRPIRHRLFAAAATLLYQEFKKRLERGQELIEDSLHSDAEES